MSTVDMLAQDFDGELRFHGRGVGWDMHSVVLGWLIGHGYDDRRGVQSLATRVYEAWKRLPAVTSLPKRPTHIADLSAEVRNDIVSEVDYLRRRALSEVAWFADRGRWNDEELTAARDAARHWRSLARGYADAIRILKRSKR